MTEKRLLILAPIMPQSTDITGIAASLSFLEATYSLDFIDPLTEMDITLPHAAYYANWQQKLAEKQAHYHGFLGFSFGGVILQQCLALFAHKPLILFSTPTFADQALTEKLRHVIHLCEQHDLQGALRDLYRDVYFPHSAPSQGAIAHPAEAEQRLIRGLGKILTTDSSKLITRSKVNYLHFIGEKSNLVNRHNVTAPPQGQLWIVPGASMRVLQDNLPFCKKITCLCS